MHALVHAANIQDRDGAILLLSTLGERFPLLAKLFADSAYQGPVFRQALAKVLPRLTLEISPEVIRLKGLSCSPNAGL